MPTGKEPGSAAPHQRERGFTYLWLLFAVLLSGAALAAIGERATVVMQRDREAELEFRGDAIRRAIASYWNASPLDARALPTSLQELTEDRRGPVVIRHLRRVYDDPFTGEPDWELLYASDGRGIIGVHSRSAVVAYRIVGLNPGPTGSVRKISDRIFQVDDATAASAPASSAGRPVNRSPGLSSPNSLSGEPL